MKYQWILFDADETLFSFRSFGGLQKVLARYGLEFNEQDYAAFQAVNQRLWIAYQNQEIDAEGLQRQRFSRLAALTGEDPLKLNALLMEEMALLSLPLENTVATLQALQGKCKMGIITNGFNAMQQKRLDNTQTAPFFELLVVSENVGIAKPDKRIFEYAFAQMGNVDKRRILMVGDTLSSDIVGGQNAGIDTCWFNPHQKPNDSNVRPTYEIHSMLQLIEVASGQMPEIIYREDK